MSAAPKISPEGNAYRLDSRDRIILEFNRPMRTVLERFQRDDGGWDLKVTVLEVDDNSWEERSECVEQVTRAETDEKKNLRER